MNAELEEPIGAGRLGRRTTLLMAIGCGVTVANLHYVQPLLPQIARDLHVGEGGVAHIPALPQVGYALGLLLIAPLGDMVERRGLVVAMLTAVIVALVGMAVAPTLGLLAVASFLLGVTTITPQLLLPFAAHLAPPGERGRVVGTVQGGLLIGVLLSRTVSGFVGQYLGWRAMYGIAAGLSILLLVVLRRALPRDKATTGLTYPRLIGSLWEMVRTEPALRQACLFGSATFGVFLAFWSTLAFHLAEPPFRYGSEIVGLFGLVGVVGVLAASLVGKLADRGDSRFTAVLGLVLMLASFFELWVGSNRLGGIVAGVILLDLGMQMTHVSNQARIYALRPEAQNRLNTIYMVSCCVGAGVGSILGGFAWSRWGWGGVCAVCGLQLAVPLLGFARSLIGRTEDEGESAPEGVLPEPG
ncbi:Predicted arabinose efflux permease, MFS family [Singulisphaera sp. GP187]|uniref:MFS transporter n=1 Tax=Singulisphaera sp. GP187 TaxID=1882752 RepID=UPI0009271518|nr:MFS transporter [Singulisphaera sp. GP187]SIO35809.1 Predicted arabinose efflux permease, MFS family [Singulisphaera sp. GP187]